MNILQIKLSTNFTFTAENPHNSLLFSMPIDEFELGPAIATLNNINNNGRNGSFYVAGYLIEERRRWPVITASPQGQCSKSVFEIALVRLSETSDYLLGQVNNPLALIRRTSGNLQQYFIFHYHFIIMQS